MIGKATKTHLRETQLLLKEKKERDKRGLFAAEGFKAVRDMAARTHDPEYVLICKNFAGDAEKRDFLSWMQERKVPLYETGIKEFQRLSELESSQGIVAVLPKRRQPPPDFLYSGRKLVVLCDGLQDPGNVGAIFRMSAAFGAGCIIMAGEAVDIYNPKVVRGSSGAILDVPALDYSDKLMEDLKRAGYKLFVSSVGASGTKDIRNIQTSPEKVVLAFGSEGKGVSDRILSGADEFFHIGIRENVESLNVGSAVAISLFVFSGLIIQG